MFSEAALLALGSAENGLRYCYGNDIQKRDLVDEPPLVVAFDRMQQQ